MSIGCLRAVKRMSGYTEEGLLELSQIVKDARSHRGLSMRKFAALAGLSHGTIQRMEDASSDPSDETLMAVAELLPYSYEELKAISQGRRAEDVRQYASAQDVFKIAKDLPSEERRKLMHLLLDMNG